MRQRVLDGLPLGGEFGEGVVDGFLRVIGQVEQQGDRRGHLRVGGERNQGIGVGRAFDEDKIGAQFFQRRANASRGAGAVVSNAEEGEHVFCFVLMQNRHDIHEMPAFVQIWIDQAQSNNFKIRSSSKCLMTSIDRPNVSQQYYRGGLHEGIHFAYQ
jgi:hypothetical protein